MKIALIQMRMQEDPTKNLRHAVELIKKAAAQHAEIICLPELFHTLYFPQEESSDAKKYAVTLESEMLEEFRTLSAQLKIILIVPFYEQKGTQQFNTAAIFDTGKRIGVYRKMHIPQDPLFYEKKYFTASEEGFMAIKTRLGIIGVLICFDQWYPEAARILALQGAEVIFYPTAIGWGLEEDILDEAQVAWEIVQRGHAIANNVFVCTVNRIGKEQEMLFWGRSFVSDPFGRILQRAGTKQEEIIIQDLDLSECHRLRKSWGFLQNRRPQHYNQLTSTTENHKTGNTL